MTARFSLLIVSIECGDEFWLKGLKILASKVPVALYQISLFDTVNINDERRRDNFENTVIHRISRINGSRNNRVRISEFLTTAFYAQNFTKIY